MSSSNVPPPCESERRGENLGGGGGSRLNSAFSQESAEGRVERVAISRVIRERSEYLAVRMTQGKGEAGGSKRGQER